MQAVILSGGLGTRLRTMHSDLPKTLVQVAGKPMLQRQVEFLITGGINRVHLAASYMADQVEAWATNQVWPGVEFTCSVELEPMGTGGGLKYTEPHLEGNQVVVVNGDSLLPNLDLPTMLKNHASSGKLLTIAISPIEEAGSFGTVEFDDQLQLTAFKEKAECQAGWVNGGVYIMELKVLESLPTNTHCSLERDLFPGLASSNHVGVYCCAPPLLDMGTPEGLQEMEAYLGNRVP